MSSNDSPLPQAPAGVSDARLAEAARYALLRRLAPSMRHHLVVNLQPIGMIYEVMDRRLKAAEPNLAEVHDSAHKINGFAKAALNSCLDVVTWLAPDEEVLTTAEAGVRECLSLVATSLTFRGYAVRNEVGAAPRQIRRSPLRNVLTALLIHATDQTSAPAELVLSAEAQEAGLTLTLTLRPTEGEPTFTGGLAYRRLDWADVQALAAAESVQVTRPGNQRLQLSIPWAPPANA
jgi:C4-dicarboxylate-specific signal transduction histidine kinase